ncbi:hypothetical protein [Mycobacterium sp.]|uniref:hypothetical protein n=1 Tax=Mycobacterium sp. TaxID=1785 RepID=UPI0031D77203
MAFRLSQLGWLIHRIADQFPNDADRVSDPDWMEFGLQRGWLPFHKDFTGTAASLAIPPRGNQSSATGHQCSPSTISNFPSTRWCGEST